jgi:hypothetical protein
MGYVLVETEISQGACNLKLWLWQPTWLQGHSQCWLPVEACGTIPVQHLQGANPLLNAADTCLQPSKHQQMQQHCWWDCIYSHQGWVVCSVHWDMDHLTTCGPLAHNHVRHNMPTVRHELCTTPCSGDRRCKDLTPLTVTPQGEAMQYMYTAQGLRQARAFSHMIGVHLLPPCHGSH